MKVEQIKTEEEFYKLAEREQGIEVIVNLNGPVFSRHFFKSATDGEDWMYHCSYVDSSESEGEKAKVFADTICKEALEKGALFYDPND